MNIRNSEIQAALTEHAFVKEEAEGIWEFINSLSPDMDEHLIIEKTTAYCLQSTCPSIQLTSLEFLTMNQKQQELLLMLERNKRSPDRLNREYAVLYEKIIQYDIHKLPGSEFEKQLGTYQRPKPELKALIIIAKLYHHFHFHNYRAVGCYMDELKETIYQINDFFLCYMYQNRLDRMLFTYHWKRNELIIARKHGQRVLQQKYLPMVRACLQYKYGLTFLFEDAIKSLSQISEASRTAKTYNMTHLQRTIFKQTLPLITAYHGIHLNYPTEDYYARAYIEYVRGNSSKARQYLSCAKNRRSPFHLYFNGLIFRDKGKLISSYQTFVLERKDFFFSRLPLQALKQRSFF